MNPRLSLIITLTSILAFSIASAGIPDGESKSNLGVASTPQFSQKVTSADGAAQDRFGYAVAVNGTTAIVGAPLAAVGSNSSAGAVYVFQKINGSWTQIQKIVASHLISGSLFGNTIAFDGTTLLIAAPFESFDSVSTQGAVYAFKLQGGVWTQTQRITLATAILDGEFGRSLAVDGNYALIGAGGNSTVAGTVYAFQFVYSHTASQWNQIQQITSPATSDPLDTFGSSVTLSGINGLIGAYGSTLYGNRGQGAVYVVQRSGSTFSITDKLEGSAQVTSNFGYSVGMDGGTALIGALGADFAGHSDQGAVYSYDLLGGTSWQNTQKFSEADGAPDNAFGAGLDILGNVGLIGAYAKENFKGAAYVFTRGANGNWSQTSKLSAPDGQADDVFGYANSLDACTILIGAQGSDPFGHANQGAAYFYDLGC